MKYLRFVSAIFLLLLSVEFFVFSQKGNSPVTSSQFDPIFFQGMKWRCIGPFRGGRSLAVCGIADDPSTFYFGAVGGGVWKTSDGGQTWNCISDNAFHSSSVGAITVAPSDANVVYVGMGEVEMRGNISFGDGIYKSNDAGKTWKHTGLEKSYAIQNIEVHPKDANLVYASCMGKVFGANKERGLYRSKDGGQTWEQILYVDDSTGCADVKLDPVNPMIMYAAMWQAHRTPYSLSSGGKGSGLYKSVDGGDHWKLISQNPGMPVGLLGRITTSVSPVNHNRVWAMIENGDAGGLFRSEDGGEHWAQINTDKNLRQRPWYFSQIYADPQNIEGIMVLNVGCWRSIDGGKSFSPINNHHGDNHDMWWNPLNNNIYILGDDGGGEITFDGGKTFTELDFPTAQFYHVNLDNDFPYNIYGAQQDNSSIRIASRTTGYSINKNDWYPVAGGEAGYIVPDPNDSHISYGGEYDGQLSKYDDRTKQYQAISVFPETWIGSGAESKQYRFNWTFPIQFSLHDPKCLYVTSQYVHRSYDGGQTWETISPDLSLHDPATLIPSGGPITKDNTGAEVYACIFSFAESYVQKGILWAGSDDGLIHVSKDNGEKWENVSIPTSLLPHRALITQIDPSHFEAGTCYISATRYKSDDTKPYLFKTTDYGKTWKLIVTGIPSNAYTRCIREDPYKKGLLYSGTEIGVYISFDDGAHWQSLNLNLPVTPVHDIRISNQKDFVVATHGRSFWILDDLTPIYALNDEMKNAGSYLFQPRDAYRMDGGSYYEDDMQTGENAPNGVILHYYLKQKPKKELMLVFFTEKGDTIISYSSVKDKNGEPIKISKEFYEDKKLKRPGILSVDSGMNRFTWDMRWPDATKVDGTNVMWAGSIIGPKATPGKYKVKMLLQDSLLAEQEFSILKDQRLTTTDADFAAQIDLLMKINKKLSETHEAINTINQTVKQMNDFIAGISDTAAQSRLKKVTQPVIDSLNAIAEQLYNPKAKAIQDVLNYPIMLNDKLAGVGSVVASADTKPTQSSYDAFTDISARIDKQLGKLKKILDEKVPEFNELADKENRPAVELKQE